MTFKYGMSDEERWALMDNFSARTAGVLLRNYVPFSQLPRMSDRALREIRGLGEEKLAEIRSVIPAPQVSNPDAGPIGWDEIRARMAASPSRYNEIGWCE